MQRAAVLFFMLHSVSAWAIGQSPCLEKINARLESWNSKNDWQEIVSGDPSLKRFTSPSKKFGQWLYMETGAKEEIQKIAVHTQYKMKSASFKENCREENREDQRPRPAGAFDDQYLTDLMTKKKNFLLVIWSPEMVYMGRGFEELAKIAKETRIPIEYFLENSAPAGAAKQLQKRTGIPDNYFRRMDSFEFMMRGVRTHMPVVYHFQNGKLMNDGWRGYKSAGEYRELLHADGGLEK